MRISDWSSDVCSSDLDQPVSGRAQLTFMDPERPITSRTIKFLELTACRGLHFGRNAIPCRGLRCNWRRNKHRYHEDRKSVVSGKSVSVRVDLGGRSIIKKKKKIRHNTQTTKLQLNKKNYEYKS